MKNTAEKAAPRRRRLDPEVLKFTYNATIELRGPDGRLKARRRVHNLIVTAGKQLLLASGATSKYLKDFAYLAIGTGGTAPVIGNTALQTEVARSTVITPTNPDANTLRFVHTFAAGTGTGAIVEAGLLDAASTGNLLNRLVFSVVNKGAADSLTVTINIT